MNRTLFICFAILFISCNQNRNGISVTEGLFIENITIITADSNGIITAKVGNLVLDGSTIVALSDSTPDITGDYKTIDGYGKYIIPGLIDSHVHLNNIAGIDFQQRTSKTELVNEYFERLPKNYLYYGYTTLIDVDNYAPKTVERLSNASLGPEIYTCGKKVQVMNDFEMVMNELSTEDKLEQPFLHDKYNPNIQYPDTLDLSDHTPQALVQEIVSEGNICVKTLYEDASSGLPQVWELPSKAIMSELVNKAHEEGMCVIMHAPSYEGQLFALEHEVDIIAHAMWNWTSDPEKFLDTNLPNTHKDLLLEIAKKGIGYQPTFRTITGELEVLKDEFAENPELLHLYSPSYLNYLKSEDAKWSKNRILNRPEFLGKINPDFFYPIRNKFESDEELFDALYASYLTKIGIVVNLMAENDGNLLFATDNGAMNMPTHVPGLNGYLEMKHWIDAGVSLEQLLKAATYNNAKTFNLLDSIGSIEVGKKANLLILNSNPLESISAYNDIDVIINQGKVLRRAELSAQKN
jgi:imidazolonepropionase-like amidohydrolase